MDISCGNTRNTLTHPTVPPRALSELLQNASRRQEIFSRSMHIPNHLNGMLTPQLLSESEKRHLSKYGKLPKRGSLGEKAKVLTPCSL